jgi:pimeloyl-ACP methyl ester carboxylesterase
MASQRRSPRPIGNRGGLYDRFDLDRGGRVRVHRVFFNGLLAQRIPVARWVDIANAAHLGVLEQPGAYATEIGAFLAPL